MLILFFLVYFVAAVLTLFRFSIYIEFISLSLSAIQSLFSFYSAAE